MADRSFLGRVANPKIFDEGSWDLDQQEGEGGPLRIVTSLNFTSLTPTNQPTNQPSLGLASLARARDIKQKILIGHVQGVGIF